MSEVTSLMFHRISTALFCLTLIGHTNATRADLVAGDLAVVGYSADFSVEWTLLALAPIAGGETIFITDAGWDSNHPSGTGNFRIGTETFFQWTTPVSGIAAGTVIHSGSLPGTTSGTAPNLSTSGDQLLLFQTSDNSSGTRPANFIYGFNNDNTNIPTQQTAGNWQVDTVGSTTNNSHLPSGPNASDVTEVTTSGRAGNFFGLIGEVDNAYLNAPGPGEPVNGNDKNAWLAYIHDPSNWTTDNTFGITELLPNLVLGGANSVVVTAVPEPSAMLYGFIASVSAGSGWLARRKRLANRVKTDQSQ